VRRTGATLLKVRLDGGKRGMGLIVNEARELCQLQASPELQNGLLIALAITGGRGGLTWQAN